MDLGILGYGNMLMRGLRPEIAAAGLPMSMFLPSSAVGGPPQLHLTMPHPVAAAANVLPPNGVGLLSPPPTPLTTPTTPVGVGAGQLLAPLPHLAIPPQQHPRRPRVTSSSSDEAFVAPRMRDTAHTPPHTAPPPSAASSASVLDLSLPKKRRRSVPANLEITNSNYTTSQYSSFPLMTSSDPRLNENFHDNEHNDDDVHLRRKYSSSSASSVLNLSALQKEIKLVEEDNERAGPGDALSSPSSSRTPSPPLTPTTPASTCFKKHILKRYSKYLGKYLIILDHVNICSLI